MFPSSPTPEFSQSSCPWPGFCGPVPPTPFQETHGSLLTSVQGWSPSGHGLSRVGQMSPVNAMWPCMRAVVAAAHTVGSCVAPSASPRRARLSSLTCHSSQVYKTRRGRALLTHDPSKESQPAVSTPPSSHSSPLQLCHAHTHHRNC